MVSPIPFPSRPEKASDQEDAGRTPAFSAEAANEPFVPASVPDPYALPPALPERARLAFSLITSMMLHAGLLALVSSTLSFLPVKLDASPPLTVKLAQLSPETLAVAKPAAAPVVSDAPAEPVPLRDTVGPATVPARFLADPDLSVLEEIPTTLPGIVSLRLHVNAQGRVERITVVRADPIPKPLLDGLVDRFGRASLSPAMIGSQPTASTLEVTIRVDPPVQLIDIGR